MMEEIKTPNIDKQLKLIGDAAVKAVQSRLNSEDLGSSSLSNNVKYKVKGEVLSINLPGYAQFVDEGTEPHMPPVDSLEKWAASKGLNAWAVAKNIEKYGTKSKPFLFEIPLVISDNEDALADAGLLDIIKVTDSLFEQTGGVLK